MKDAKTSKPPMHTIVASHSPRMRTALGETTSQNKPTYEPKFPFLLVVLKVLTLPHSRLH